MDEFIDTIQNIEVHIKDCALKTMLCKYCNENIEKINFKILKKNVKLKKLFVNIVEFEKVERI